MLLFVFFTSEIISDFFFTTLLKKNKKNPQKTYQRFMCWNNACCRLSSESNSTLVNVVLCSINSFCKLGVDRRVKKKQYFKQMRKKNCWFDFEENRGEQITAGCLLSRCCPSNKSKETICRDFSRPSCNCCSWFCKSLYNKKYINELKQHDDRRHGNTSLQVWTNCLSWVRF